MERLPQRPALKVSGLHEIFRVYAERPPGLKERLYRFKRARYTEFHALNGIDLTVEQGETVALIGHNGSGKSTLLKCIAGIYPADRGTVEVNGRIATLLELGAGFHEELSGRENVYLNGAILGLARAEIEAAFDDIVEFAGVGDFIDSPVRNYSSGMYVRLGFAIAVHVDPDILLVDEVLSVGDVGFQEKSLARMRSFSERGKTVVLVSHDLGSVQALCERTVVLNRGEIAFDGPTDQALEVYAEIMATGQVPKAAVEPGGRTGDGRARISAATFALPGAGLEVALANGAARASAASGAKGRVTVTATAHDDLVGQGGLGVGLSLRRPDVPVPVYETRTSWRGVYLAPPPPGECLEVRIDLDLALLTGTYLLDVVLGNAETGVIHDRLADALELTIEGPGHDVGVARLDGQLQVSNPDGVWPEGSYPPPLEEGGPRYHPWRDGDWSPGAEAGTGGARTDEG